MLYRTHIPRQPLGAFVEQFWYCEGYEPSHAKERVLPDGSLQIVISLRHDTIPIYGGKNHEEVGRLPGCLVSGPRSRFEIIGTAELKAMAGVHFKPGGAVPFLGVPAGELTDLDVALESLWGPAANELRERVLDAGSAEEIFRVLETLLLSRAASRLALNPTVISALREFHRVPQTRTISDVAEQSGWSQKRFIELFRDAVGLTPKRFCRVRRFREALQRAANGRPVDWTDVALSCGYFDQSHFVHDFRAFAGLSPSAYLEQRSVWETHTRLDA